MIKSDVHKVKSVLSDEVITTLTKESLKYVNKRPFKEGDRTPYGTYVGRYRNMFWFSSGQKDGKGKYLANTVSVFAESEIEYLLENRKR